MWYSISPHIYILIQLCIVCFLVTIDDQDIRLAKVMLMRLVSYIWKIKIIKMCCFPCKGQVLCIGKQLFTIFKEKLPMCSWMTLLLWEKEYKMFGNRAKVEFHNIIITLWGVHFNIILLIIIIVFYSRHVQKGKRPLEFLINRLTAKGGRFGCSKKDI